MTIAHALGDIASRFGLELRGDASTPIRGVATLAGAGPGQLSFLANPRYRAQLAETRAGAVVTRDVPDFALVVGNPAKKIGWVSESGDRLGADLVCPRTKERYRETGGKLEKIA